MQCILNLQACKVYSFKFKHRSERWGALQFAEGSYKQCVTALWNLKCICFLNNMHVQSHCNLSAFYIGFIQILVATICVGFSLVLVLALEPSVEIKMYLKHHAPWKQISIKS